MSVVVVAPHPDDEAIGCGGAVLRHADAGDEVRVAFLSSGELGLAHLAAEDARAAREREAAAAAEALGVTETAFLRLPDWTMDAEADRGETALAVLLGRWAPDVLYAPHDGEWHPDHRTAHAIAAQAALRTGVPAGAVRTYEVWTPLRAPEHIEDVGAVFERKLAAIRCYPSQLTAFDYVRAATGLAQYRGALAGRCAYAEAFGTLE